MRALLPLVLSACFTAATAADRHRATVYNTWEMLGGLALSALIVTLVETSGPSDDAPPAPVLVGGYGLFLTGAVMTVGGLAGIVTTQTDLTPTH